MDLISIIIPVYNAEKYIGDCLTSVFAQDWQNIEVIIVNDGSTDGTLDIINEYTPGYYTLINKENGGTASAYNAGIKASRGKWIKKLEADDILEPGCLRNLMEYAKDENTIYYGNYSIINKDGHHIRDFIEPDYSDIKKTLIKKHVGNSDTILFHRNVWNKVGSFNENLKYGEDYEWTLRAVLKHDIKMKRVNRMLAKYRRHPDSKAAFKARENKHEQRRIEILESVI